MDDARWEMLDEVDITSQVATDFGEQIDSKKWTDRRDALQTLFDLIQKHGRLDPNANYGQLVGDLKKVPARAWTIE
jgi:hypothetical protein